MINKENFVKIINAIQEQREIDRKATEALDSIFIDVVGGFYDNETLFSVIENYLVDTFKDEGGWLGYFIYDLDFGKDWKDDCCSESDGTIIDISTVEKLYDFLVLNSEG